MIDKAIILAAGKSSRYGSNKLVERIKGKSTVQYCVEFCIENEIKDCYITISKNDMFIEDSRYISHPIVSDLRKYENDINLYFSFQDSNEYGPGAAIKCWDGVFNDDFLCLFGDNYYSGDIKHLLHKGGNIITYKEYKARTRNLQLATIIDGIVIEKPHSNVKGLYFCGFMIFSSDVFSTLDLIKKSDRNEYEITHLINSVDNLEFCNLEIDWYDLTYENDKSVIEEIINKQKTE